MMTFRALLLVCLLAGGTAGALSNPVGYDPCATFFWTDAYHEFVERYKPEYLVEEGLEDVGMGHIIGSRIRHTWSTQAADCIASANRYGYFSHPDFELFPDRGKKLSEKLLDVRDAVLQMSRYNADPVYRESLRRAKIASYAAIESLGSAVTSKAQYYDGLVAGHDFLIGRLDLILDVAIPPEVRAVVLDTFCSPESVANLASREGECITADHYCELTSLYQTINACAAYQNGATLDDLLEVMTENRAALEVERDVLASERDSISALWAEIEGLE